MVRIDKLGENFVWSIAEDNGKDTPNIHAIGKRAYSTKEECLAAIRALFMLMGKSIQQKETTANVEVFDGDTGEFHDVELSPELEDHNAEYE